MAGEENKTLQTVKDIYTFLISEKFDRTDLIIALGGKNTVLDKTMLHYFCKTAEKLAVIQSFQGGDIHVNQFRHVKSAYHIFIAVKVNPGFPAYAGVRLGQQGGWDLDKINSPVS